MNVILPCAGYGTRLGLSTPKELYEIVPGVCLIDFSLCHVVSFEQVRRVVVVIREGKEEVFHHVMRRLQPFGIEVKQAVFCPQYEEWAGSVMSAEEWFLPWNVVLLPDSVISLTASDPLHKNGVPMLQFFSQMLETSCFALAVCHEHGERLRSLGAVRVEGNMVIDFADKPSNPTGFNAFWVSYGFHASVAKTLYHFLLSSIHHKKQPLPSLFFPAPSVEVDMYIDLGTWESIALFRQWLMEGRVSIGEEVERVFSHQ